jgi:methionine synthase I (cobalamin-dependent)
MNFVFMNAQSCREVCAGTYKTETALQALVIAALAVAAAAAETFSTTVSVTGYSAQDVGNVSRLLVADGYTINLSGSTLTISW